MTVDCHEYYEAGPTIVVRILNIFQMCEVPYTCLWTFVSYIWIFICRGGGSFDKNYWTGIVFENATLDVVIFIDIFKLFLFVQTQNVW